MRSTLELNLRNVVSGLLCLALVVSTACAPGDDPSPPSLLTLPEADMTGVVAGARQQLQQQHKVVEALQRDTDSESSDLAQAFADLGLLYVIYDLHQHAAVCFENALRLDADNYRWSYLQGYLRGLQGNLDEATALYLRSLDLEPEFVPALLRLGRSQLTSGRTAEAKAAFERVVTLDPSAAAGHEGLGKAASADGDEASAISHFERALELDRDANSIHYALAVAHRNLGHMDPARAHLQQAGDVAARIVDPLINPLAGMAESPQFYLAQGAEALDNGDFETAATAFQSALDRKDTSFGAFRGLAISLERLGDPNGARRTLEQALDEATTGTEEDDLPERAGIERSLGLLAATLRQDAQALAHYQTSLALRPDQPDLLLRAGNALARSRRFEEAIASYDRLIELEPEWTSAILEKRAIALVNLRRWPEAVADFTRAIEAAPEEVALRRRFAEALELMGNPAGAREQRLAVQRLTLEDTSNGPNLAAQATARRHMQRGEFTAAAVLYREVLAQDPNDLESRLGLANALGQSGQFDDAAQQFEHVIRQAPRHAEGRRGQIVALVLGQHYGPARVKLQEALRTFPRHASFALTQVQLLTMAPEAKVRDGDLALEIALRVYAERQDSQVQEALALALAATGDITAATALQRDLVTKAESQSATDGQHIKLLRTRLATFEAGRSWLAASPDEILSPLLSSPP